MRRIENTTLRDVGSGRLGHDKENDQRRERAVGSNGLWFAPTDFLNNRTTYSDAQNA